MKNLLLLSLLSVVLWACGNNASPATGNEPGESGTVEENSAPSTAAPDGIDNHTVSLQGTWKRISYPYGTIIFQGGEVKFVTGEGAAEEPEFHPYKISKDCPAGDDSDLYAGIGFLVVESFEECNGLVLKGDTLTLTLPGDPSGITYVKE